MFLNYLKIALRNLRKNRLFSVISIVGLAIGMTVYIYINTSFEYEKNYDHFFSNIDRIYAVGSFITPDKNPLGRRNFTYTTVGPIIEAELLEVEAVARSMRKPILLGVQDYSSYESVLFVDPAFLTIFDFNYLQGNSNAFATQSGVVISETKAIEYFGRTQVIGETITLDNQKELTVAAVITDIPRDSHFHTPGSGGIDNVDTHIFATLDTLVSLGRFEPEGYWWTYGTNDHTYVLLPEQLGAEWLQSQLDSIYDRFVPAQQKMEVAGLSAISLRGMGVTMGGMPATAAVTLISMLILAIACANYSNLAIAQSMGRSREVGLRKTLGASQFQLLVQFLVESILIASIAMIVATVILELLIPLYNNFENTAISLNYIEILPKLILVTLAVGLLAGLYPAWLIIRTQPVQALRGGVRKGKTGATSRALMIGLQFGLSAFMIALIAVLYVQSKKIEDASHLFPRAEIYTLSRLDVDGVVERLDILKNELEALPAVDSVAFSSGLPYQQFLWTYRAAADRGDEGDSFRPGIKLITPEFLATYDITLIAGRNFDKGISNDHFNWELGQFNVIVNELTVSMLGINSPEEAINQRFYWLDGEGVDREFIIVGVVPTQNIRGLLNPETPWMFMYHNEEHLKYGSIRISGGITAEVVSSIEAVWKRVVPGFPIKGRFLDEVFELYFSQFHSMYLSLGIFFLIAFSLALFGLFGLAVFMTKDKTKEIGIRKVLGASSKQVAQVLVWQFAKPVIWSLVVALPAALIASVAYLNVFSDRIELSVLLLLMLGAGCLTIFLAWVTVASHTYKVSQENPVAALRHE